MYNEAAKVPLLETPFLVFNEVNYVDPLNNPKKWYGVSRKNNIAAVNVFALTPDNRVIFVTQYRPYINRRTIELPAGLMDVPGESVIDTARRELLEETGYAGDTFRHILGADDGLTISCGITDERLHLVLITNAVKVAEPYTNEGTEPFTIPLEECISTLMPLAESKDSYNISYPVIGTICLIQHILSKGEL